ELDIWQMADGQHSTFLRFNASSDVPPSGIAGARCHGNPSSHAVTVPYCHSGRNSNQFAFSPGSIQGAWIGWAWAHETQSMARKYGPCNCRNLLRCLFDVLLRPSGAAVIWWQVCRLCLADATVGANTGSDWPYIGFLDGATYPPRCTVRIFCLFGI